MDLGLAQANKFFFVNGERIATRATSYQPVAAWQFSPAYRWFLRPLLFVLIPVGVGLALFGLIGIIGTGLRLNPPAWVQASGMVFLSLSFLALPWTDAAAVIGSGSGPSRHGSHTEGILIYGADHLGSTRVVIDAWGDTVETRDYAPSGKTVSHTGDFQLKHQFTSQPYDDDADLHYYGARMYNQRWGRFLSPDEAVEGFDPTGLNPYSYARNQPASRVDPTGNISWGSSLSPNYYNPWSPSVRTDNDWRDENTPPDPDDPSANGTAGAAGGDPGGGDPDGGETPSPRDPPEVIDEVVVRGKLVPGTKFDAYTVDGSVVAIITGGDPALRLDVARSLDDIFSTGRGKKILQRAVRRRSPFRVRIWTRRYSWTTSRGNTIQVAPNRIEKYKSDQTESYGPGGIFTRNIWLEASLTRKLAHEIGHVVMKDRDVGPGKMYNTDRNENPIMEELGEGRRIQYRMIFGN